MKTAEEEAKAICRWFWSEEDEPLDGDYECPDYAHMVDVIRIIQADALNRAASLCASSKLRGILKERAIRDCIRLIQAEADKLTKP